MSKRWLLIFLVGVLALAGLLSKVFAEESDSVKIKFIDGDTGEIINNRQICYTSEDQVICFRALCPAIEDDICVHSDNDGYVTILRDIFYNILSIRDDNYRWANIDYILSNNEEKIKSHFIVKLFKQDIATVKKLFDQNITTIKVTYEEKPCIGTNNLAPVTVKRELEEGRIEIFNIRIPEKIELHACKVCYPACSMQYEYEIDVKDEYKIKVNSIINWLKSNSRLELNKTP